MGNNRGNALALIALFIGIGGVGFGAYSVFFTPKNINPSPIREMWTLEQAYSDYLSTSYSSFGGMAIDVNVRSGETLLIELNVEIFTGSGGTSESLAAGIRIMLDYVEITGSEREAYTSTTTGDSLHLIMTTQVIVEGLLGDTYEIRAQAKADASFDIDADGIRNGLLIIYAYK